MARSRAAASPVSWNIKRFVGKTFAFAGQFSGYDRRSLEDLIEADGGEIVAEVSETLDYLVVGNVSGKSTLAQKKLAKLHEQGKATARVLRRGELLELLAPDRHLAEAIFRAGEQAVERWRSLRRGSPVTVDLTGSDLRGVNLRPFWLWGVQFEGADLRDVDLGESWNLDAARARLDGACLIAARVKSLREARLRKADLSRASLYGADLERIDATGANLTQVSGNNFNAAGGIFARATLTGAMVQQCRFAGANFTGADLTKADLRGADLSGACLARADLRGADLSQANLSGADLTRADLRQATLLETNLHDACLDGADFTGANLQGVVLDQVDTSKAKGLTPAIPIQPGPHIEELARFAAGAARVKLEAKVRLPNDEMAQLEVASLSKGKTVTVRTSRNQWNAANPVKDVPEAMILAAQAYLHGHIQLDTVKAKAEGAPYGGKKLHRLAVAAWCEAFGRPVASEDDLLAQVEADRVASQKNVQSLLDDLRGGPLGVERWNRRPYSERRQSGPYEGADLHGARMDGVDLSFLSFPRANLEGASLAGGQLGNAVFTEANLKKANLSGVKGSGIAFHGADLTEANLRDSNLRVCKCRDACLRDADLSGADASYASFQGANLTGAKLNGTRLEQAEFDERTVWPAGFSLPGDLRWKGKGTDPRYRRPAPPVAQVAPAAAPALNLTEFMERLRGVVDGGRLANALQMLKGERFHLYSQVEEGKLIGVIRSQSSDARVYACKLAADGSFSCGTQNLRVCGGLGGAICKHLLVMIVGLAKSGQVDLGQTYQWVRNSRAQRPLFDKDEAAAVFLRHKGAEAGEIDWRPTETIPEDYHIL